MTLESGASPQRKVDLLQATARSMQLKRPVQIRRGNLAAAGATHVIFEPLDFIARLAALVPQPRLNLTSFYNSNMNLDINIRPEAGTDVGAIREVTVAAFATLEISNQTEHFIVEALRTARALTISLVAEADAKVVGHIAFSPVTISDGTPGWYGLGPVSVLPVCQGQGIGKALIQKGLDRLRDLDARGCCLVGHPEYYRKFGFRNVTGLVLEGVPPEFFFALAFAGHTPQGTVGFHKAFQADGQQEGSSGT